jgi:small subunit ribosomal protein S16
MAVRIRLSRIGKKKAPFYRIVAVDQRAKRDGEYLENLGTYNPLTGEVVKFHAEKLQVWLSKGAVPSDTVVKIQKQHMRAQKEVVQK